MWKRSSATCWVLGQENEASAHISLSRTLTACTETACDSYFYFPLLSHHSELRQVVVKDQASTKSGSGREFCSDSYLLQRLVYEVGSRQTPVDFYGSRLLFQLLQSLRKQEEGMLLSCTGFTAQKQCFWTWEDDLVVKTRVWTEPFRKYRGSCI